jgi:hypothetical protein
MKNKILLGTVAFVAVLAVIGLLAVSFTMTPVLATNATNVTEKINVTCTTAIAIPDSTLDVGAGYIPQACIDCWIGMNTSSCEPYTGGTGYYNSSGVAVTTINTKDFTDKCWVNTTALNLPESIHIKNKGNNYISLSIKLLDDSDWTLQTGGAEFGNNTLEVFLEQGMSTPGSDDTRASCIYNMTSVENEKSLVLNTQTAMCGAMSWTESQNEVYLFDKFLINPKTEPKQYVMTKEISAADVQCGGNFIPPSPPVASFARADPINSPVPLVVYQLGNYGMFVEMPAITLTDSTAVLSAPYSIAFDNSVGTLEFMEVGTGFGTDNGDYMYYQSGFSAQSVLGISSSNWDANVGGTTIGGPSITLVNGGAYLLQGKGGSSGQGDVYVATGTPAIGFGGLTNVGNLCTLYGITCSPTLTPAAIFDMYKAYNAAQHPTSVLGVVFADTVGADSFAVVGAGTTTSSLTKITTPNPMTLPLVANSDAVRSATYSPFNGELLVWVDAVPYTNGPEDYIASYILLRNGNDIVGIVQIANWPNLSPLGPAATPAQQMYGLADHIVGIPPGFIGQSGVV